MGAEKLTQQDWKLITSAKTMFSSRTRYGLGSILAMVITFAYGLYSLLKLSCLSLSVALFIMFVLFFAGLSLGKFIQFRRERKWIGIVNKLINIDDRR